MKTWDYLDQEEFHVRQYSILPFLKEVDHIIEIGPGKNPLCKFVKGPRFTFIEPYMDESNYQGHHVIRKTVQETSVSDLQWQNGERVALVCFGVDYDLTKVTWFAELWNRSHVSVFESITDLPVHRGYLDDLKKIRVPTCEYDVNITFRGSISEHSWPPRGLRKILVYKSTGTIQGP